MSHHGLSSSTVRLYKDTQCELRQMRCSVYCTVISPHLGMPEGGMAREIQNFKAHHSPRLWEDFVCSILYCRAALMGLSCAAGGAAENGAVSATDSVVLIWCLIIPQSTAGYRNIKTLLRM